MVPAVASFVLPLLAPVPLPDLETCAALALLVSDAVPASTFDRRPPTRWQPSSDSNPRLLEAACDDGAMAAVGLITQGRPADSFGLSERCLLGDRIFLMSPRLVYVQAEVPIRTPRGAKARSQRSRRAAETRFDRTAWGAASSNHTTSTIQSSRTTRTVVDCKYSVPAGTFAVLILPFLSLWA